MRRRTRFFLASALAGVLVAAAIASASVLGGEDVDRRSEAWRALFGRANSLYDEGNYEEAIQSYEELIEDGVVDKDLYYNLANAYYKHDDLGRAVLYYERALRLAPREKDTRENLALVRSQLRDKQFVQTENRAILALIWFHNNLSTSESIVLASCLYLLFCLLLIAFVSRDTKVVSGLYRRLSVLSPGRLLGLFYSQDLLLAMGIVFVIFVPSCGSAYLKIRKEVRRDEAVVVQAEIPVFSGPSRDSTLQFKIHEGTVVRIREVRSGWASVRLPGGLAGWLSAAEVERV